MYVCMYVCIYVCIWIYYNVFNLVQHVYYFNLFIT